jgi:NAD(P)-dependent dehydrogenase (short-subunit alcohol dehydrogenase family)
MPSLKDKTVLIIGRGSGIARAIALAVTDNGGQIIAAGRHVDDLVESYRGMNIGVEQVDVTDESSIAALAARIPTLDHVVATASARARQLRGPDREPGQCLVRHQGDRTHPAGQALRQQARPG